MKKLIFIFSLLVAASSASHAAPVSVASFLLDDEGFVRNLDSFTGSLSSSNYSPTAITDNLLSTWIYSPDGSASVALSFDNPLYNSDNSDLALFFLHGSDTGLLDPSTSSSVNLSINGVSNSASSSLLYTDASQTELFGVITPTGTFGLSVALVEFSDFGLGLNSSITDMSVDLGVGDYLALAGGFHLQPGAPIPLPAPLLLLLSGLAALGLIGRRKQS